MLTRELIAEAARRAGLVRLRSCCGVPDKYCATDEWRGNLEGFAAAILRLAASEERVKDSGRTKDEG